MEWFSQNWVWILFFTGMIAMHMFGRGGGRTDPKPKSKDGKQRTSEQESEHKH